MCQSRHGWMLCGLLSAVILAQIGSASFAQPVTYPPTGSDEYKVHLRYRIRADRDGRILQFRAMNEFLDRLGFVPEDREDADLEQFDPIAERLDGTIPNDKALQLLDDPRIQTILLIPSNRELPEEADAKVQIRIRLNPGLGPDEEQRLHRQTVRQLERLGFEEAIAYFHDNYRLVRGSLPRGELFTLLKDVRFQPTGWFLTERALNTLPSPFRNVLPIRVIEVLPDLPEVQKAAPLGTNIPEGMSRYIVNKLTDDLKLRLAEDGALESKLRVEAILDIEPIGGIRDLQLSLLSVSRTAKVEGLTGLVATIQLDKGEQVYELAALPELSALRLPRRGSDTLHLVGESDRALSVPDLLEASKVARLQELGFTGQGARLAIIASEFPEIEDHIGTTLPKTTKLIDLTAELNDFLVPSPVSKDKSGGTLAALVAHAAAPKAQLTLIRVDPAAYHQLLTVARAITKDRRYSIAMQAQSRLLTRRSDELTSRRDIVVDQYRRAFGNLSDEDAPRMAREKAQADLKELLKDEQELNEAVDRFKQLKEDVDGLAGVGVVVNTLVWETGFPHDGLSELSQFIEEHFVGVVTRSAIKSATEPPVPGWVQPASEMIGQIWTGPYLDADDNRILEFTSKTQPLPEGRWTSELNFLGYVDDGEMAASLPEGQALRLTVQWREPRFQEREIDLDPEYQLVMKVLRQLDPSGEQVASDEMIEVASSTGPFIRLRTEKGAIVYELSMSFVVPEDGVYAIRVERERTDTVETPSDIQPIIVVQNEKESEDNRTHPVFVTFVPREPGVGIPGEVPPVLSIGTIESYDSEIRTSLVGAGPGLGLRVKPDLFVPDTIRAGELVGQGSGIGSAFVAGASASLLSYGIRPPDLVRSIGVKPGSPFVLPSRWVDSLRPRKGMGN